MARYEGYQELWLGLFTNHEGSVLTMYRIISAGHGKSAGCLLEGQRWMECCLFRWWKRSVHFVAENTPLEGWSGTCQDCYVANTQGDWCWIGCWEVKTTVQHTWRSGGIGKPTQKNVTKHVKLSSCAATQDSRISALDSQACLSGAFHQSLEDGVSSTHLWSTSNSL